MVINLAAHTAFNVDTVSGTVSLTRAQLQGLVDGNYTTDVVTLSGSDILVLEVDLGQRIATQDLRYYFDSATASGTVASGIQWYYKKYDSNPWYPLTTTIGDGYYTTTTFSGIFYPNYVRLVHTISGTGITGSIREFEVNSNDDIVDFGTDGSLIEKNLEETPIGISNAYTAPIYNDGDQSATAYIYIGNTDTDADEMLRISDAQNGTYINVDDGKLIDGGQEGLQWSAGSHNNTTTDNNKLVLNGTEISYDSGWDKVATTLQDDCRPACIAWHDTDPGQSVIYYIKNNAFYKYEITTGAHTSLATVPRNTNSSSYGGNNDLVYDPEGNRVYYFVWDDIGGNYDHLYAYYYDVGSSTWSGQVLFFNDPNSNTRRYTARGAFLKYPGTTDSTDGLFEVGERYIIVTISAGHSTVFRNYRLRLSDHDWSALTTTGYIKEAGDYTGTFRACGVCIQEDNLDDYAAETVAVVWSYAGSTDTYEYLNSYAITASGGAAQAWAPIKIKNISPRDPSIDSWFYNDEFTGRGKFFFYDEGTDRLYFASDYQNDVYSVWYNVGGQNLGEGTYRLYRSYDRTGDGTDFYDTNWQSAYLFGDGKRYDDGLFRFMGRLYDEELWMNFPVSYSETIYQNSGTYTTPIFKNADPTYWRVKAEIPANTQIATTSGVHTPTIEIRSSDIAPAIGSFHRIAWFARRPTNDDQLMLVCTDYDGTELWTYEDNNLYYTGSSVEGVQGWCQATNTFYPTGANSSSRFHYICWYFGDNSPTRGLVYGRFFDIDGNNVVSKTHYDYGTYVNPNYHRPTNAIINKNNLVYCTYRGVGSVDDRLEVYDTNLNTISSVVFTGDQSTLYSLCLADDEEDIWIIKEDENAVYRYNQNLVQQNIIENSDFGNINGICEDNGGGIFIGETGSTARKIWHYDADGTLIEVFDVTAYMTNIHRLRPDYYGGVWALDTAGDRLVRFNSNGVFLGQTNLLNPTSLDSTVAGCWVMSQTEEKLYFVDFDMTHQKTIDTTAWGGSDPRSTANDSRDGSNWRGALALHIDIDGYIDADSVTGDNVWGTSGSLEWNEVDKDINFVPYKTYHQARITLRGDGTDTPEVEKVALPPAVTLYNIGAGSYKNAYLKTVVPDGIDDDLRQGKIRTWFSVEE